MEIVIDIDDDIAQDIIDGQNDEPRNIVRAFQATIADAIKNGTPLPKGHGDLVDRDAIEVLRIGNIKREYDKGFDAGVSCMVNRILETPTIIEGSDSE